MGKPLLGSILGVILGLAAAVVLQQQGIWPLDQLTVFLLPAITGLVGLLMLTLGRPRSTATLVIALLLLLPMAVWGALGFGEINENGTLDGGCQVTAQSSLDSTTVTDTSRRAPFEIDPDGSLTWAATSPFVFMDYDWRIWVDLGGIPVTLDSDIEPNDDGSQVNGGMVPVIAQYAEQRGINIDELRGIYKVGGDANAMTCSGFGFVTLVAEPFETLASKIALGVGIMMLILLVVLAFTGREAVGLEQQGRHSQT